MPYDPFERFPWDGQALSVTRLGFGAASIGGLFTPVSDADALAVARHAWDMGIRYFDVAPLYGYGSAERRLGAALADRPRDAFILSTKVGRLVRDVGAIPPGADLDRQALRRPRGRLLRRHGRAAASSSTTAPTASGARSRRAWNAWVSRASTSPTSTIPMTTGRRPSTRRTRRSTDSAPRASSAPSVSA